MKLLLLLLLFVLVPLGVVKSQPLDSSKQYILSEYNGDISINDYLPDFEIKDSIRNEYRVYVIDIKSIEMAYLFQKIDFSTEASFELINKEDRKRVCGYGIIKSEKDAIWYCKTKSEIQILSITNGKKREERINLFDN